jgi:hypothetical protein
MWGRRAGVLAASPHRWHTKKDGSHGYRCTADPSRIVCFRKHRDTGSWLLMERLVPTFVAAGERLQLVKKLGVAL